MLEIRIKICLSVQCRRWSHGWEEGRRQKEVKEKLNIGVLAKAVTAVLYKSQSPSRQFHAFLCGYSWDEDELSKLIHTRCGKYFPPLSLCLPVECHVISGFILRGKNITEQSKVVILSSLHCCIQKLRDVRMGKVRKHKQKAPRVDPVGLDSAIAELQHGMDQVGKFFLKMML